MTDLIGKRLMSEIVVNTKISEFGKLASILFYLIIILNWRESLVLLVNLIIQSKLLDKI